MEEQTFLPLTPRSLLYIMITNAIHLSATPHALSHTYDSSEMSGQRYFQEMNLESRGGRSLEKLLRGWTLEKPFSSAICEKVPGDGWWKGGHLGYSWISECDLCLKWGNFYIIITQ